MHHHGIAGRILEWGTSRLEHTLGVWTVVVAVAPDDRTLRVATLLHDVGHTPYSHALEGLEGVDHHASLEAALYGSLGAAVVAAGHDLERVRRLIDGREASPLRNREGWLHADHLDSFVRGARVRKRVAVDAGAVLAGIGLDGPHLAFATGDAETLVAAVADEAAFQLGPLDVGSEAWLVDLVGRLIDDGAADPAAVLTWTDADLEARLRAHPSTREEFAALLESGAMWRTGSGAGATDGRCWTRTKRARYLPTPRLTEREPAGWRAHLASAYGPFGVERTVVAVLGSRPH